MPELIDVTPFFFFLKREAPLHVLFFLETSHTTSLKRLLWIHSLETHHICHQATHKHNSFISLCSTCSICSLNLLERSHCQVHSIANTCPMGQTGRLNSYRRGEDEGGHRSLSSFLSFCLPPLRPKKTAHAHIRMYIKPQRHVPAYPCSVCHGDWPTTAV